MDAGDEVGEEQRVGRRQPQGPVRVHSVQFGQFRHVDHAEDHAHQGRDPEQHDAAFRVHVGGPDHELFDPQEQLPVGDGGFGPHSVGAQLEVVGQRRNAVFVGVEALHHEPALADVRVDVAAEQRHGEHQRQAPRHRRLERGLAGAGPPDPDALAEPQPGADQQHAAEGQQDNAEGDAEGLGAHPDEQRDAAEFGCGGKPADADRTDRHEQRAQEPGKDRGPRVVDVADGPFPLRGGRSRGERGPAGRRRAGRGRAGRTGSRFPRRRHRRRHVRIVQSVVGHNSAHSRPQCPARGAASKK